MFKSTIGACVITIIALIDKSLEVGVNQMNVINISRFLHSHCILCFIYGIITACLSLCYLCLFYPLITSILITYVAKFRISSMSCCCTVKIV